MREIRVVIEGHVQGVGFRAFAKKHADRLGLHGYAANVQGDVEIVAQGHEEELREFVHILKRGPTFASVDHIDIERHDILQDHFYDFEIR